jgi:hypothetical protein
MRVEVAVNITERGRVVRRVEVRTALDEVARIKFPPPAPLKVWTQERLAPAPPPPAFILAPCGFCVRGIVPAPEYDIEAPPRPCAVCGGKGVLPILNRAIPPRPRLLRLKTALLVLLRLCRRTPPL